MTELYAAIQNTVWRFIAQTEYYLEGTYTGAVLTTFWNLLSDLWYYLLLGALVSVLASRLFPKDRVSAFLKRRAGLSILICTLIGLISPMCTFAAIPFVGALIAMGMPAPPLMAFLVSSPLMNPSLFVYTAGMIGWRMAIARTLSAFLLGLAAGYAAHLLVRRHVIDFSEGLSSGRTMRHRHHAHMSPDGAPTPSFWREARTLGVEFASLLGFIGKYFLLGILIASLVQVLVSPEWVASLVGPRSRWSVLTAVAMGVPLYACGGGSIPIIEVLLRMGMSSGAALAFFLAGPATKISTVLTLHAVVNRRVMALYFVVTLVGAALMGYLYSAIAPQGL